MYYRRLVYTFLLTVFCGLTLNAQSLDKAAGTDPAIIREFMSKRFGMFIHWGPVALRGTEIGWSRGREVPKEEYDNLYKEFNPVSFDADAWVKVAKDAGMKYLTITARHHDGFSLWPSEFTDYDIAATPYKKDIVGALAKACKQQGIEFCIYYSILDWYHPDYPIHGTGEQPDPKADMDRYVAFMKNQLKELITRYDPYMLWFDGGWESPWTNEMGKDMYAYLKTLKPDLIVNNRLGKAMAGVENKIIDEASMVGDYDTPEQVVGRLNMNIPWESCFTICNQWAWRPDDPVKSLDQCLDIIAKTAGGNGNLLLNVGPTPEGEIEASQVARLQEIGQWLKTNGAAIYNTRGGPYEATGNYATTRKGSKIYLHVLNTDASVIELPGLPGRKIVKATLIDKDLQTSMGLKQIAVTQEEDNIRVQLPDVSARSNYVIELQLDGDAESIPVIREAARYGMVTGIKPDQIDVYKQLHANAWPAVLAKIRECNIRNYSIYLKEIDGKYYLFSYFEYTGDDFEGDMAKMAADAATQRWWSETDPTQLPLPDAATAGETWSAMEEVFHTR